MATVRPSVRYLDREVGLLVPLAEVGAVNVLRDDEAGQLRGAAYVKSRRSVGRAFEYGGRGGGSKSAIGCTDIKAW